MSDKLILISAGHSNVPPRDPGAVSKDGKHVEAVLALRMRDAVSKLLREKGLSVIEDGADGVNEPLRKAILLARRADYALEFHFNAGPPTATGIEALSLPSKKVFAQKLCAAIELATNFKLRGDKGWKNQDAGQHPRLGFCQAGGVVVELCFLSNPSDIRIYLEKENRIALELAEAIAAMP